MDDSGKCLDSFKVHDISRFLKNKFRTFQSKGNIDSDLADSLIVSCDTENVDFAKKSKEACFNHQNVLKQTDDIEKKLLDFEVQSHVNKNLKELSSKSVDFPIEKKAQLSSSAVISNVQTFKVEHEAEELNSNSSNYANYQRKEDKGRNIVQCFGNLSCKQKTQNAHKSFEREDVFIAAPNEIVFREYRIGIVHEIPLFIKNVGQTSRNLRIIPPRTPFFSLGLGQFPSCTGSIAPGLHCMFAIKFCPDSLANYKDCLVVEVEQSNNLIVPLKAIRPPPILKMPASFDLGDCLLGKVKSKIFRIENEGAPGKFCFVPESRWPAIKLKTLLMEGVVKVGEVFELKTICFELSTRDVVEVEVKFSPVSASHFSESLLIICDNCQLKRITLTGKGGVPKIEIVDVEGGRSSYEENEMKDASAQHLLRFPSINLHSITKKMLILKNCIDVDVPFHWLNFYSQFEVPRQENDDTESCDAKSCVTDGKSDREFVPNSYFTIDPKSGLLPACGIMKFDIIFSPEKVGKYQEVIHFEVEFSQNQTETSFCKAEEDSSLTLELIGVCSPQQVSLLPQVLLLPAPLPIQVERKHSVKIVNKSSSKVSFKWENVEKPYTLSIRPVCGEVSAESEKFFEVSLHSDRPYDIDRNVRCFIDGRDCIALRIIGEFACPKLSLSTRNINFGLVCVGQAVDEMFTITNPSPAFVSWFIHGDDSMDFGDLTFIPDWRGSLRPFEEQKVVLRFKPSVTGKIHQHLKLSPYMGSTSTCFEVEADAQVPLVCLEKSCMKFCDARLKKNNEAVVKLFNQTAIAASFQWLDSLHDGDFVVALEPERGCIGARGSVECKITFYPVVEGAFSDIVIPCQIANSKQFVFLCISAVVKKPQESFEILVLDEPNQMMSDVPEYEPTNVELNYGLNNKVWTVARKYLLLTSHSEEEVEFNLNVTSFNPSVMLSSGEKAWFSELKDAKVDKETKFVEQQIKCLQKKMFKNPSAGVAFLVHPSSGSLAPNEKVLIMVAALADTFGNYTDNLHCQVGCSHLNVPVEYGAKGCPVHFQMMAPFFGCTPTNLRFGQHYCGSDAVKRCVEVANDSSIDILLDWEMYFVLPTDPQVVDIVPDFEVTPDVLTRNENKVLRLKILTHKGLKINQQNLFSIHPSKSVVKAKDRFNFEFTFCPPSCATNEMHHSCIASSLITIESICDRYICGHLSRRHKFELETLDLNLTADTIVPKLAICYGQDEGFRFKCSAGDLMVDGSTELKDCLLDFNKAQILNEGAEDVCFDMLTRLPFGFVVFQCGVALRGAERKPAIKDASSKSKFWDRSNVIVLRPRARIKVKVVFSLTPDMLRRDSLVGGDYCEDNQERKLHFMDDLRLRIFSSPNPECGHLLAEQKLPLYATVASPKWSLSMDCINFGVCFVNQSSRREVTLTNTSSSASYWMIESCPPCDEFQVVPSFGTFGKSKNNETVTLEIHFTPREVMSFQGRFIICGILEEPTRELVVMGIGTLDEHFMSL